MANRKNLANGILALGVDTDETTWVLEDGYGAGMPDVPFYLTATPFGQLSTIGNSEIVNVTARTIDTLTVERAAKGTTARAFAAGAVVSNGIYTDEKWGSENIDWATFGLPAFISPVGSQSISGKAFTTLSPGTPAVKNTLGGAWSGSIYTIPEDGLYLLIGTARVTDAVAANGYGFGIGTSTEEGADNYWQGTGSQRKSAMYTRLASFSTGALIRPFIYVDFTGTVAIYNITMQILKVG